MLRFLAFRIGQSVFVLLLLSWVIFLLIQSLPIDLESLYVLETGRSVSQEELESYKKKLGLDAPLSVQYFSMMSRLLQGDFGRSERYQVSVSEILPSRIVTTLKLTVPVFLLSLGLAIPLGISTVVAPYRFWDSTIQIWIFLGISIPTFWTGLLAIYLFSLQLGIFPAGGIQTLGRTGFLDQVWHFLLPIFVLSFQSIGIWVRYLRGSLLEVLHFDYIRSARAKGLSETRVLFKHALRNALIPMITLIALFMPHLVSGALVTEQIFGIPGMGQLLLDSVIQRDREVALTAFLFLAFLTLLLNLLADLLYKWVDPRIQQIT